MKKQLSAKKIRENEQFIASAKKEFAKKFDEFFSHERKYKTRKLTYRVKESFADKQERRLEDLLSSLQAGNMALRDKDDIVAWWIANIFSVADQLVAMQWVLPTPEDPGPLDGKDVIWIETEETRQASRIRGLYRRVVETLAKMAHESGSDTYRGWRKLYVFVSEYFPPLVHHHDEKEVKEDVEIFATFRDLYADLWADLRLSGKDGGRCRETGSWARRFVSYFDAKHGYVELKCGNQRSFRIPEKSSKAWAILTSLFRSEDPDGWTKLPTNWKSHFMRKIGSSGTVDAENDLVKIAAFIRPHTPGKGRSGDGKYRFAPILISAEKLK